MRRTASETIRHLEARIARLEKGSSVSGGLVPVTLIMRPVAKDPRYTTAMWYGPGASESIVFFSKEVLKSQEVVNGGYSAHDWSGSPKKGYSEQTVMVTPSVKQELTRAANRSVYKEILGSWVLEVE